MSSQLADRDIFKLFSSKHWEKKTPIFVGLKRCKKCDLKDLTHLKDLKALSENFGPQHHSQRQKVWKARRQQPPTPSQQKFHHLISDKQPPHQFDSMNSHSFTHLNSFQPVFFSPSTSPSSPPLSGLSLDSSLVSWHVPNNTRHGPFVQLRSRQRSVENIPGKVRHLCPSPVRKKTNILFAEQKRINSECICLRSCKSRSLLVVATHIA